VSRQKNRNINWLVLSLFFRKKVTKKLSATFVATKQVLDVLHPNRNKQGGMIA
jgi:hypothetical protein